MNVLYTHILYYIISILTRQTAKLRKTAYGKQETRVVQFPQIGFLCFIFLHAKRYHVALATRSSKQNLLYQNINLKLYRPTICNEHFECFSNYKHKDHIKRKNKNTYIIVVNIETLQLVTLHLKQIKIYIHIFTMYKALNFIYFVITFL